MDLRQRIFVKLIDKPSPMRGNSHGISYLIPEKKALKTTSWSWGDGNLVFYRSGPQQATRAARTTGKGGTDLVMQGDGNLVLYKPGGGAVWTSATGSRRLPGSGNVYCASKSLLRNSVNLNRCCLFGDGSRCDGLMAARPGR